MSTNAPALQATELIKRYAARGQSPVLALDRLSLEVTEGSVFALLGPNGAGKSTTVKILSTLSRPDDGQATVVGLDVLTAADRVRRAIGLISQKSSADPMATGRENVTLAARIQGLGRADARHRADELLDRFDLTEAGDRLAKTYSGGMARKLDVAIGLVHRPRVLFLDEPTTGLDPEARADMWAEIARLAADEQMTVLLTTHYLEEADRLADRLAIVDAGRVVVEGTPEELKNELRGDTVTFEFDSTATAARALPVLASLAGDALRNCGPDGPRIRARADSGARAVPTALAALEAAEVAVGSVTVARPSLDDVYLRYVGRSFEAGTR